jgi:hypothetical protein
MLQTQDDVRCFFNLRHPEGGMTVGALSVNVMYFKLLNHPPQY